MSRLLATAIRDSDRLEAVQGLVSGDRRRLARITYPNRTNTVTARPWVALAALHLLLLPVGVKAADVTTITTAIAFYQNGDLGRARGLFEDALAAIDSGSLSQRHLASCLRPLSDIYRRHNDFEKALRTSLRYRKTVARLKDFDEGQRRRLLSDNLIEIADLHTQLGRHTSADRLWSQVVRELGVNIRVQPQFQLLGRVRLAQSAEIRDQASLAQQRWGEVTQFGQRLLSAVQEGDIEESLLPEIVAAMTAGYKAVEDLANAVRAQRRLLSYRVAQRDVKGAVRVCSDIGDLYLQQHDFDRARQYLEKGLQVARQDEDGLRLSRALLLQQLSKLYHAQQRTDRAREFGQQATQAMEDLVADDGEGPSATRMMLLARLQEVYQKLDQPQDAVDVGRRLLDLRTEELGSDHALTVEAKGRLGALWGLVGDYGKARPLLLEARDYWEARDPPAPLRVATVLNDLAVIERATTSYQRAEPLLVRALELREEHLPADSITLAYSHANLAAVLSPQGRYAEAVRHYDRAIGIMQSRRESAPTALASTLLNMAMTYKSQGQLGKAIRYCEQALDVHEAVIREQGPGTVAYYNALAALHIGQSDLTTALRYNEKATNICQEHSLTTEAVFAAALHHRATVAYLRNDLSAARNDWEEALKIQTSRRLVIGQARSLNYLAKVSSLQGHNEAAEKLYREVIDLVKYSGAYPIMQYLAQCNLAELLYDRGEHAAAREVVGEAVSVLELPRAGVVGAEAQRARHFHQFADAFDLLVDWYINDELYDEAIETAERARNRTFLDQMNLAGVDLRDTLDRREHGELLDRELSLRVEMGSLRTASLQFQDDSSQARVELSKLLDKVQEDYRDVHREIRNASDFYRGQLDSEVDVSVSEMRDWLEATSQVMLFYVLGDKRSHLFVLGDKTRSTHRIELSLATSDGQQVPLTRQMTADLVHQFMLDLRKPSGSRGLGEVIYSTKGARKGDSTASLTEALLPAEAREMVAKAAPRHVVIVPDGALHQLPFEALPISGDPAPNYILDLFPPIYYSPSAAILANLVDRSKPESGPVQTALTVGNPVYQLESTGELPDPRKRSLTHISRSGYEALGGQLSSLPGTEVESQRVSDALSPLAVTRVTGPRASERRVREQIGGQHWVHLAAHGMVHDQYENLFGAIALSPSEHASRSADDDGFLELREIQTLPMLDCRLVVLSACQTSVGPTNGHEAGNSLAQAMLIAGAHRVISSHWNVDDESTAQMMGRFFSRLADNLSGDEPIDYARALQEARREVRAEKKWSAPYYWGAFVLIGPGLESHSNSDSAASETNSPG